MVIDKQTMQRARRVPDAHAHRAIQTALDHLDAQPARRRTRWAPMAAAGAAALMLVAVLAAVPPLRHRAVSFALDALGRAVPQSDRVNPAGGGAAQAVATARADSGFLLFADAYPFYAQVGRIAQVVGISQTVNGITVTVEEAAVTLNRLFLELRFENVPQNCFPAEEALRVTVNGQACPVSSQKLEKGDRYAAALDVLATFDEQDASIPVKVAFALRQFPDGGQGEGERIAVFDLRFEMKPTAFVYVEDQHKGPVLVAVDSNAPAETPLTSPDGSAPTPEATAKVISSLSIKLTDLPNPYPPDQSVANGDYVNVHGGTSNSDRMAAFMEAVSAKRPAAIRCTNYTVEGDAIIADVVFDGSMFTVNIDTTRDAFGEQKVTQSAYRNMRAYAQDGTMQVYLTNEDKLTQSLIQTGFDGYLLTSWQGDSAATPAAEVTEKAEPTATPAPVATEAPSAGADTARPKYNAQAEGWTEYDIKLGSKTLSFAAPSQLKCYDLTTPEQRVHLASMELSYNDETDGVIGWPSVPSLLNDNGFPLVFFDGEDGVIQVLAYDPGTASMDGAVQKLDSLWSCGDTSEDAAGNQVTQLIGRTTDKYQSTSSLLLYRLPKGEVTIDGKSQPCPFLIVRVVSHKDRDLWMAILQDNISIQ